MKTLISRKLVKALESLEKTDELTPHIKTIAGIQRDDYDIAVIAEKGDMLGYGLTEVLNYLLERADKTDETLDDMAAGIG